MIANGIRERLGTPYQLIDYNCEHANNEADGLGRWSPQIENIGVALFGISVGLLCVAAASK